jgi:hypothetical protein
MKYHLKHTLKIPADAYFKVITAPEFDAALVVRLNLAARDQLEKKDTPDRLYRKVRMVTKPVSDTTRAFLKVSQVECIETFDVDRKTGTFKWDFIPNVMAEKIHLSAVGKVTPAGPGSCVRDMTIDFQVKVFLVGSTIEKRAGAKIEDGFAKINAALEEFYKKGFKG